MRYLAVAVLSLTVLACGQPDNARGPGGVTVGEAKALDEAAEMVEAQRLPAEAMQAAAAPPAVPASPPPKP